MHNPSVATLREGQRCRALGGRIPMDWVATFLRIAWQLCRGLAGNFPADWVAEFRGIRTQGVPVPGVDHLTRRVSRSMYQTV